MRIPRAPASWSKGRRELLSISPAVFLRENREGARKNRSQTRGKVASLALFAELLFSMEGGERSCVYRTLKMGRGRKKRGSMCKWSHYSISNPPPLFPLKKLLFFSPGKKVGKVHNLLCAGELGWFGFGSHPLF